ncbi:MAG: hypothetical protein SF052_01890 [Bacteroidia bacterium]|nr:hypothetical protein [Bacteroidia bacterium]
MTGSETLPIKKSDQLTGIFYLILDILISVAAQLVLKHAMHNLGSIPEDAPLTDYLLNMISFPVIAGLALYGLGIVFWILCLTKLDLSFAYPAGTMQYFLIFIGAWILFDEQINFLRIAGALVIIAGVVVMSKDIKLS